MSNVTTLSTSIRPAPIAWVESLFDRMTACYGNKFLDMWRGADMNLVKRLWADEMGKLSNEDLKRGYAALMTRDWPPSLPEYVKMCKPTVDPTVAYYEALNGLQSRERGEVGTWSHPAIFWASVSVSSHDLKNLSFTQIKPRWEKALQDEMDKGQWAPVPVPMVALPAPGKTKSDREHAARMLSQYKADSVMQKSDDRAWVGKVLERAKRKDETLPAISLRFAKEALGVES